MDERDHKAMNEELNQPSCLGAVIRSFPDNVKTTEIYTHVSNQLLSKVNLPI